MSRDGPAAGAGGGTAALLTLQNVVFPEPGVCTEPELFFHIDGPGAYDAGTGELVLEPGAVVRFDTYFNALSIGKWHAACAPAGLHLALRGRGRVAVRVLQAIPNRSREILVAETVALTPERETLFDLSHYPRLSPCGVICAEIRADGGPAAIRAGRYVTRSRPDPDLRLALCITTFRREAQVEATVARLRAWMETADLGDRLHVFVVDNGRSARIPAAPRVSYVPNANLGGAGGFARGLIEARAAGFSHVLFMDDDAGIPMENLDRTLALLALSQNPRLAVAGAMINNTDKWRMWENGAVFDRRCRPLFNGLDLRDAHAVLRLEFDSAAARPERFYGGWWFFAFPVAAVRRMPFPFFVRGDDISFSLANDFDTITLNGVVSFQDDFSDKESPLTLYLDLRNHMIQHLALPQLALGPLGLAAIGLHFVLRNLARFHYETVEALLIAWADVLRGPGFFAAHPDAAARRAEIRALTRQEAWKPLPEVETTERRRFWAGGGWRARLFKFTLNGHLLPFADTFGNRIVLPAHERNRLAPMWGARRMTFLNAAGDRGYTVRRSRRRCAMLLLRAGWLVLRLAAGYRALRAAYRTGYPEITTDAYWTRALALPDPAPRRAAAPAGG